MGIRFQCEHCRKRLNVKSHQAGEQCVCPMCGGDILIPAESSEIIAVTERLESPLPRASTPVKMSSAKTRQATAATSNSKVAVEAAAFPAVVPSDQSSRPTVAEVEQESFQLGKPRTIIESDPFDSSTKHVWYLRHKQLGEKGPLQNDEVKVLLESKQLPRGYIVWRDDWNDWIGVETIFPDHYPVVDESSVEDSIIDLQPDQRMESGLRRRALIFGVAIVVAFLMLAVLFYLWKFQ